MSHTYQLCGWLVPCQCVTLACVVCDRASSNMPFAVFSWNGAPPGCPQLNIRRHPAAHPVFHSRWPSCTLRAWNQHEGTAARCSTERCRIGLRGRMRALHTVSRASPQERSNCRVSGAQTAHGSSSVSDVQKRIAKAHRLSCRRRSCSAATSGPVWPRARRTSPGLGSRPAAIGVGHAVVLILRDDAMCILCCEMLEDCAAALGAVHHEPKAGSNLRKSRGALDGLLVLALQKIARRTVTLPSASSPSAQPLHTNERQKRQMRLGQ
jgi:hypothetical protein